MPQEAYDMIKKYRNVETYVSMGKQEKLPSTHHDKCDADNHNETKTVAVSGTGKLGIAAVVTDPRKFIPQVIHKGRKFESFIENTEPRLVYNMASWKNIRIGLEKKSELEQQRIRRQSEL